MISDTNSLVGFVANYFASSSGFVGGDVIVLGMLVFGCVLGGLIFSKARAGTVVVVTTALAFMISIVESEFMFLFWVSIIVSLFVLINGLRKWMTGY
jgi:hypothetical protein